MELLKIARIVRLAYAQRTSNYKSAERVL